MWAYSRHLGQLASLGRHGGPTPQARDKQPQMSALALVKNPRTISAGQGGTYPPAQRDAPSRLSIRALQPLIVGLRSKNFFPHSSPPSAVTLECDARLLIPPSERIAGAIGIVPVYGSGPRSPPVHRRAYGNSAPPARFMG